jgi:hypothetical protein
MEKVKFKFKVNDVEVEGTYTYEKKPSREQIENDIKDWFFGHHYMWFSVEQDGKETNLEDF